MKYLVGKVGMNFEFAPVTDYRAAVEALAGRTPACARCRGTSIGVVGTDPTGRFGAKRSGQRMSLEGRIRPASVLRALPDSGHSQTG